MTPSIYDLGTSDGMRQIVGALFTGYNYRLYTEGQTRHQLITAYQELLDILKSLPRGVSYDVWMAALRDRVGNAGDRLEWWLLGLGKKTADNLGVNKENRLAYFDEIAAHLQFAMEGIEGGLEDAMLMLWAGAATLTIRGSQKSRVGKRVETAFMRSGLTILGLSEGDDFWLGIPADAEVDREVDCEIATRRGRIRLEIGLIEAGNPEVIMDKVTRVGTRGMVIFDRLGPRSNAGRLAANNQVAFIQIRNNRPLTQMYQHLDELMDKPLQEPPTDSDGLHRALQGLPDSLFVPEGGS